jgi:hypothetical protein|tara:strand:- start:94 stop:708 length:615 start_codon:yes stop_codon:yes gene_type:complete
MSSDYEMWVKIGMSITALIGGAAIAIKSLLKRKSGKKKVGAQKKFQKTHTRIHEVLTELRLKHDSARTLIMQFHNGGVCSNGESMKRFSCTHESVALGVPSIMHNQQDMLLSRYPEILQLSAKDTAGVILVAEMEESNLKRYYEYNHILAFSLIPLKNELTGLIIGYIASEWCRWENIDDINEAIIEDEIVNARRLISVMVAKK